MKHDLKYCIPFDGEITGLSTAKVKRGMGDLRWNKHLPVPLENEETVYIHPDQSSVSERYIKIIQVGEGYKITTIFGREMFIFD
jgi:hypothetical protein